MSTEGNEASGRPKVAVGRKYAKFSKYFWMTVKSD